MNTQQAYQAAREAQVITRDGIHLVVFQLPGKRNYSLLHVDTTAALLVGRGLNVHKGVAWAFAQIQNHRTRPYNGPFHGKITRAVNDYVQTIDAQHSHPKAPAGTSE